MKRVMSTSLVDRFNPEPKIPYEPTSQATIDIQVEKRKQLENYFQRKFMRRNVLRGYIDV